MSHTFKNILIIIFIKINGQEKTAKNKAILISDSIATDTINTTFASNMCKFCFPPKFNHFPLCN